MLGAGFAPWANTRNVTRPSRPALRELGLLRQVEAPGLGRPARKAGAREPELAGRAVGRAGQLRALRRAGAERRLVGPEDLFLGLAGEQRLKLLALDRLALEQQLGDRRQRLAVLEQHVLGDLVGGLDDTTDLVVDLARDLVGVVRLGRELAAEERLAMVV